MLIAKNSKKEIHLLPEMANRHGLITGSTGTGKTTTLRVIAENFSKLGVPVFLADVKGDLSGLTMPGYGMENKADKPVYSGFPVLFWDVFGLEGHPIKTTISNLGPLLLARLLNINQIQTGIVTLGFKITEDYFKGTTIINLNSLKTLLRFIAENSYKFTKEYGNINYTSIGVIQRNILELEIQGVNEFLNLPVFDVRDFFVKNAENAGIINIFNSKIIINRPKLYTTMMLWLLHEIYDALPEKGDLEKPVFVFCFDEAHLLFKDISVVLLEKMEQVIRLIRSKGVGIYFITQSPLDIPKTILGQLGNRIQHSLRAFTPEDFVAINKIARTFRQNPSVNIVDSLTNMATGEALISLLDEEGAPNMVERAFILPPESRLKPLTLEEINIFVQNSPYFGKYERI